MKLDVSSLAHTKISYRICAEIQETDHIRKEQTGYRTDAQKAVRI